MESEKKNNLTITGISGSLRKGSYSKQALKIALSECENQGSKTNLIDLNQYNLPLCTGEKLEYNEKLEDFKQKITKSQAIILSSPEYHGSYSGVLKNALDLLSFKEMEGKICGLIAVSGGINGGLNLLINLREVIRSVKGWTIIKQVSIARVDSKFKEGKLIDQEIETRLKELVKELILNTKNILNI